MPPCAPPPSDDLGTVLERPWRAFHKPEYLQTDPIEIVRRYPDDADREVTALIAASFAFGNVKAIRAAVELILRPLGEHPAQAIRETPPGDWRQRYRGFRYRWVSASDLRVYLAWIGAALRHHGSLGALWAKVDDPAEESVMPALERWREELVLGAIEPLRSRTRLMRRADGESRLPSGAHLLLTAPSGGSACKRMCLFLRWVCRPDDGVDLGLWPVDPARLVMPLDVHIGRAARLLGLTKRRADDLKTAVEITRALRAVDPADPCRFDFALARIGMLGVWTDALPNATETDPLPEG